MLLCMLLSVAFLVTVWVVVFVYPPTLPLFGALLLILGNLEIPSFSQLGEADCVQNWSIMRFAPFEVSNMETRTNELLTRTGSDQK